MSRVPILFSAAALLSVPVLAQSAIDLRILRRYELEHLSGTAQAYAFGDLSGDGRVDAYISKGGGAGTDQLLLACPGGGYIRSLVDLKDLGNPSFDVKIVDVDGDGDNDIVTIAPSDATGCNTGRVLINVDGRGDLQAQPRLPMDMNCGQSLAVGNVDNDDDPDLFIGGVGNDPNLLLFNTGGYFAPIPGRLPAIRGEVKSAVMFDADGDTDLDIALARSDDVSSVLINEGMRTGRFVELSAFCFPSDALPSSGVAAGDFDGDRFVDLVFSGYQSGVLPRQCRIMKNLGGCFRQQALPQVTEDAYDVCVGDLDGDGDLDLAFACRGPGGQAISPVILVNDGNGSFARSPWAGRPVLGSAIAAADVDDDRDLDLWVGSEPLSGLGIDHWYAGYERQLDGPFSPEVGVIYQLNLTARIARTVSGTSALLFIGNRYIQPRFGTFCGGLGVLPIVAVTLPVPPSGDLSIQAPWGGRGQLVFQALILPGGSLTGACFTNVVGDAL